MDTQVAVADTRTPTGTITRSPARGNTVEVTGDLDLHSAPDFLVLVEQVLRDCAARGDRRMEIRFAGLEFCDSSGIAALVRTRQYASGAGIAIALADCPQHLVYLLRLSGLEDMFEAGGVPE
jgi:anti-anti-sigma factor